MLGATGLCQKDGRKMKTATNMAAQGDGLFRRIEKLPKTAVEMKRGKGEKIVALHSETGHHHTIAAPDVRFFNEPGNPFISYLQLGDGACEIVHERGWDVHETLALLGGKDTVWEVRKQREMSPEGWARSVAD